MRVHPTELHSSGGRWQLGGAMMLIAFFMGWYVFSANNDNANAGTEPERRKAVVVVQTAIPAGAEIQESYVRIERLPLSALPADVVSEEADVIGKFSRDPLPVGAPIGRSLLSSSADALAQTGSSEPVDPVQQRLEALYPHTVAVTLPFVTAPAARGSRIAVSIQGDAGRSVLVAGEAWVERVDGNFAQIRVPSHMALFLEEAKALGVFSSLIIPLEGESPFSDQAVTDIIELRTKLTGETASPSAVVEKPGDEPPTAESFSSYAWIRGNSKVFAIDGQGRMHVISKQGEVAPLYPFNRQYPSPLPPNKPSVKGQPRMESGIAPSGGPVRP